MTIGISDYFDAASWVWRNRADLMTLWTRAKPILDLAKAETPVLIPIVQRLAAALQSPPRPMTVSAVQGALRKAGHPVTVDGKYGPETHAAVEAFQRDHSLVVDGWVGPATMAVLEAYAN